MVKRYYCDYCDRTLPYSVEARKKHTSGQQHRNIRNLYYQKFKTPIQLWEEEKDKKHCNRFFSTQGCKFGQNCIYSHLNEASQLELKLNAELQENSKSIPSQSLNGNEPSVEEFMARMEMKRKSLQCQEFEVEKLVRSYSEANPLVNVQSFDSLPPSLKNFNVKDLVGVQYSGWG